LHLRRCGRSSSRRAGTTVTRNVAWCRRGGGMSHGVEWADLVHEPRAPPMISSSPMIRSGSGFNRCRPRPDCGPCRHRRDRQVAVDIGGSGTSRMRPSAGAAKLRRKASRALAEASTTTIRSKTGLTCKPPEQAHRINSMATLTKTVQGVGAPRPSKHRLRVGLPKTMPNRALAQSTFQQFAKRKT